MPKKILVVDDNVDTRDLLHLYLTKQGYDVIIAADGGEGLYRAKAGRPDLIITDMNMPGLDGREMIEQLREEPGLALIPIIALTAYGRGFTEQARKSGADAACEKPFEFEALIGRVRELLGPPS